LEPVNITAYAHAQYTAKTAQNDWSCGATLRSLQIAIEIVPYLV